jgi:[ribosomal protein S18]-alanine N-acetyltransferase
MEIGRATLLARTFCYAKDTMNIRIHPMLLGDLQDIMKIEPLCFGVNHWSRESFTIELSNSSSFYFVARRPGMQDELVGYTGFWQVLEEAHLTTLAVNPAYRRQGVGEQLLLHSIGMACHVGARWMTLEVRASNQAALALYHKYGFKECGKRPHYYHDNDEDALVLWTGNIRSDYYQQMLNIPVYQPAAR